MFAIFTASQFGRGLSAANSAEGRSVLSNRLAAYRASRRLRQSAPSRITANAQF